MYGYYKPYVPVSQRYANAARHAAKSRKEGVPLSPVVLTGRNIANSYWGQSWCDAMESYGDFANRLPRGRTYVRNGFVVDLRIESGLVSAAVAGSELYRTTVRVTPMAPARWRAVVDQHAAQVSSLIDLLQGKLPSSLLRALTDRSSGLFPDPGDLVFTCSCPDWASMCKHVAAVLYGVGARLDNDPGLFFLLRGVDVADLAVRSASVGFAAPAGADDLAGVDLSSIFGIDLGGGGSATPAPVRAVPAKRTALSGAVPPAAIEPTTTMVHEAKAKAKAKAKPKAKPKATAPERAPISDADLRRYGVDAATVARWLRAGVLSRTTAPGVYTPTAETGPHLRAVMAAR